MSIPIYRRAEETDAEEILKLQYLCYQSEAQIYNCYDIQPLTQKLDEVKQELHNGICYIVLLNNLVVGSIRCSIKENSLYTGKLITHPRVRGNGIASHLMELVESEAVNEFSLHRMFLFTGNKSFSNIAFYEKRGYKAYLETHQGLSCIWMEKIINDE